MPTKQANIRQQRWKEFYIKTGNAALSSRMAGYKSRSDVQGSRLLGNVRLMVEIDTELAADKAKNEITEVLVTENFQSCFSAAFTAKQFSPAIQANAELAKHIGYYAKDKPITNTLNQVIITDEDRVKWLQEQALRLDRSRRAQPAIAGEVYIEPGGTVGVGGGEATP